MKNIKIDFSFLLTGLKINMIIIGYFLVQNHMTFKPKKLKIKN